MKAFFLIATMLVESRPYPHLGTSMVVLPPYPFTQNLG